MCLVLICMCLLAVIFSILMIVTKNPIYSVLYLILIFFCISIILLILGIEFIALTFLIVYVGAIAVLFLFVVMMLNIKIIELREVSFNYVPIGILISITFLFFVGLALVHLQVGFRLDTTNINGGGESAEVMKLFILSRTAVVSNDINTIINLKVSELENVVKLLNQPNLSLYFNNLDDIPDNFVTVLNTLYSSDNFNHPTLNILNQPSVLDTKKIVGMYNENISMKHKYAIEKLDFLETYFFLIPDFNYYYFDFSLENLTSSEILGSILYTYTFYIFFIISLILLLVMVGSIVLVLNQNINIKRQLIFKQVLQTTKDSIIIKKVL